MEKDDSKNDSGIRKRPQLTLDLKESWKQFSRVRREARQCFELLSLCPQLKKINKHLEKRNRALTLYRTRALAGFIGKVQGLGNTYREAEKLNDSFNQIRKRPTSARQAELLEGQDEQAYVDLIIDSVYGRVENIKSEIISEDERQGKISEIRSLAAKVTADLQRELEEFKGSDLYHLFEIESLTASTVLQKIDEPFPGDIGLGKILEEEMSLMERAVSGWNPQSELLNRAEPLMTAHNFTSPEVLSSGAFGIVYTSRKKILQNDGRVRTKEIVLKSCIDKEHSSDLRREGEITADLFDVPQLVVPTATYTVENPLQSYGFPEGAVLLEYPYFPGVPSMRLFAKEMEAAGVGNGKVAQMRWRAPHVVHLAKEMAEGLEVAHKHGVIHMDFKPENLLSRKKPDGSFETKLLDWGSATEIGTEGKSGSPTYCAPEVFEKEGCKATPQMDIYSLGVSIYVLLTGDKDPFGFNSIAKKYGDPRRPDFDHVGFQLEAGEDKKSMTKNPFTKAKLEELGIPGSLAMIIEIATQKDPSKRYQSMGEMKEALDILFQRRATESQREERKRAQEEREEEVREAKAATFFGKAYKPKKADEESPGENPVKAKAPSKGAKPDSNIQRGKNRFY